MSVFDDLAAEFPRSAISWRAQSLTKNNDKAMALAYIDARDVMNRLDAVVGPENWQNRYEVHGNKTICYLSIREGGEWITKADGAGDTDVEAEKGSISDALKRAAVLWGIGRYLYDVPTPWVPCDTYEKGGKHYWSKWKEDPWNYVKAPPKPSAEPVQATKIDGGASEPNQPSVAARKAQWQILMNDLMVEAKKGSAAIANYMNHKDTDAEMAKLGKGWAGNFRNEAKEIYIQTKAVEDSFGAPPKGIIPPSFEHLQSGENTELDEMIDQHGRDAQEQERT